MKKKDISKLKNNPKFWEEEAKEPQHKDLLKEKHEKRKKGKHHGKKEK